LSGAELVEAFPEFWYSRWNSREPRKSVNGEK
jgi:hypothetical protein